MKKTNKDLINSVLVLNILLLSIGIICAFIPGVIVELVGGIYKTDFQVGIVRLIGVMLFLTSWIIITVILLKSENEKFS
jgi:hypothetical protein